MGQFNELNQGQMPAEHNQSLWDRGAIVGTVSHTFVDCARAAAHQTNSGRRRARRSRTPWYWTSFIVLEKYVQPQGLLNVLHLHVVFTLGLVYTLNAHRTVAQSRASQIALDSLVQIASSTRRDQCRRKPRRSRTLGTRPPSSISGSTSTYKVLSGSGSSLHRDPHSRLHSQQAPDRSADALTAGSGGTLQSRFQPSTWRSSAAVLLRRVAVQEGPQELGFNLHSVDGITGYPECANASPCNSCAGTSVSAHHPRSRRCNLAGLFGVR